MNNFINSVNENLYDIILIFDNYAFIIVFLVSMAFIFQTKLKKSYVRWFKYLLADVTIGIVVEYIVFYNLKNNEFSVIPLKIRFLLAVYIFTILVFPLILYVFFTKLFDPEYEDKKIKFVSKCAFISIIIIDVLSLIPNFMFTISNGMFKGTNVYHLVYLVIIFFIILILKQLHKKRKLLTRVDYFLVISYLFNFLFLVLLEFLFNYVPMIQFLLSGYILITFITIFTSQEYLEVNQPVYTYDAFKEIMSLELKKPNYNSVCYLFISDNYETLSVEYGLEELKKSKNDFSKILVHIFGKNVYTINENRILCVSKDLKDTLLTEAFINDGYNFSLGGNKIKLTPLISRFFVPSVFNNVTDIVHAAKDDTVLKIHDKSKIIQINDNILTRVRKDLKFEETLREKLKDDSFDLQFRPIYNTKSKKYSGIGIYLMFSKKDDYLPLLDIARISAKAGLLSEFEECLFSSAGKFYKNNDLDKLGIDSLFVYITTIQISTPLRALALIDAFNKYSKKGFNKMTILLVEVPGDIDYEVANENIRKLKEAGASIYLSEFGSGYSSLDFILKSDFDGIKISHKVTTEALKNQESLVLLRYLLRVGRDTNKKIYLSGIHTNKVFSLVEGFDIEYYGGKLFGDYMDCKEIVEFIESKNIN